MRAETGVMRAAVGENLMPKESYSKSMMTSPGA